MLTATLTYGIELQSPIATFALDCPMTVVGRDPEEVRHHLKAVNRFNPWKPYQVRLGDTHFIVIPDVSMSRRHFCIRRDKDEFGEAVFVLRHLFSLCGIFVNGSQLTGEDEVQLKDGDWIRCSSSFVFNLKEGNEDVSAVCAEPKSATDGDD